MKAAVIIDNIEHGCLRGEWGLSICIDYEGKHILLDTGSSELFTENAPKLGIDLSAVDLAVLSHAHYDHGNGMGAFFRLNDHAPFYVAHGCAENCYSDERGYRRYIGLPKGVLTDWAERILYVSEPFSPLPGVLLLPHTAPNLDEVGKKERMFRKWAVGWKYDDFSHEQSLIFDTEEGLVVFNSCSHGGVINILREVTAACPGRPIRALIGGFHLFPRTEEEVRALAADIRKTGIQSIYTGHCTGETAFGILREELGDMVHQLHAGLVMTF